MTVNREHWKPNFENFPPWLCPTCQNGNLAVLEETLKIVETGPSEREREHPGWEPDWIIERFAGLLACQNAACGQIVAVGGRTRLDYFQDWDTGDTVYSKAFEPAFLYPAPPVFLVSDRCPKVVAKELKRAFALYWADAGSCANGLRAATEMLLTDRKVPRTKVNRNRKRERISLHNRIETFKQKDAGSADLLLAIKWLGNEGSHASADAIGRDDLLHGFELFEHVVEQVYDRRAERLKKVAKDISSRKGRPAVRLRRRAARRRRRAT